jgi:anti-sigma B factor antagonist
VERSSGAAPPRRPGVGIRQRSADGDIVAVEIERPGDGLSILSLAGELDLSTIPKVEPQLSEQVSSSSAVVVDLTRLSFIDSSGIGLLIKAYRDAEAVGEQAADGNGRAALHTVVAKGSQVERVFGLAGIGLALPLFLDRHDAVAALGPGASDGERPG